MIIIGEYYGLEHLCGASEYYSRLITPKKTFNKAIPMRWGTWGWGYKLNASRARYAPRGMLRASRACYAPRGHVMRLAGMLYGYNECLWKSSVNWLSNECICITTWNLAQPGMLRVFYSKTAAHFKFNHHRCFEYINMYRNALLHIFIYNLKIIVELFIIFYLPCIKDNDHFNDSLTACVLFCEPTNVHALCVYYSC